jgi:hypothetical protein
MTTEDHTEREGATGRGRLRAHARDAGSACSAGRSRLGVADRRRGAEADRGRAVWLRIVGHGAPPARPVGTANSATKILFCTRDRRPQHLVAEAEASR